VLPTGIAPFGRACARRSVDAATALSSRPERAAETAVSDDQFFQFVSLLAVALFIASGALPLSPRLRRFTRVGAAVVLAAGLAAALVLLITR
jgi:lipopolysaccharide export LptBFGC system permease protein LptF